MNAREIHRTWDRVAAIEETVVSADGHVEVTVDARGEVRALVLDPAVYRDQDGAALASTIMTTVAEAAAVTRDRAFDAMTPLLPRTATARDADLAFDPLLHHLAKGR